MDFGSTQFTSERTASGRFFRNCRLGNVRQQLQKLSILVYSAGARLKKPLLFSQMQQPARKIGGDDFDWVLRSPLELPPPGQWRYATLAAMLRSQDPDEDQRPLLVGADHTGPLELSLADLRRVAGRAGAWCAEHGFAVGDSLLLARLPDTSEVPLAAAVVALMSHGLRVVLPMNFDQDSLTDMARATNCRAMLWCAGGVESLARPRLRQADAMYRAVADTLGLATFSLDGELDWHVPSDTPEVLSAPCSATAVSSEREVLVLSTSGSTGRPKLVRYSDQALLRVAEAWQMAGLMDLDLTGGRSICPTLSHSMGLRSVLHAVWNRQPVLLAQAEWLEEKPKKFVKLLERCAPQHITCGPALLGDLMLLAANVRRVRTALASLCCVVSSGAAAVVGHGRLPGDLEPLPESDGSCLATGSFAAQAPVKTANAFGMTEVQQVLNTLLGGSAQIPGALGRPLPGVSVAVRWVDAQQQLGRLYVAAPFAARGYVGQPDFGEWLDTGDLVRVVGDELIWVGRGDEDFLSTGHGVKVSLAELQSSCQRLHGAGAAVLFVDAPRRGGVAALVYVGERDPAAAETQHQLLAAIVEDHQVLADKQRDFALAYLAISVVGCVAGLPPKRGPGKVDRPRALAEQAELLAVLDDPLAEHPQVFNVPSPASDRPDWRRFAAGTA